MVRGDDGKRLAVRKPGQIGNCKICGSDRALGFIGDADQPEARMLIVFIHDTCVVFVLFFLFLGFGFGVRSKKGDLFAVMGPGKAADVALAFCERCGFAAIHGEKINLLVGVAI